MKKECKVGDYIRCVAERLDVTVGKFYKIIAIDYPAVQIIDDVGDKHHMYDSAFEVCENIKILEENKNMKKEYKVGDYIRCLHGFRDLTFGKRYKIIDVNSPQTVQIIDDVGDINELCEHEFEACETLDYEFAESLIGRKVHVKGLSMKKYKITHFVVADNNYNTSDLGHLSTYTIKTLKDGEKIIIMFGGNGINCPLNEVIIPPTSKTVKLNDEYDAIITKDTIQVDGQTFPVSIIDDLNKAVSELNY